MPIQLDQGAAQLFGLYLAFVDQTMSSHKELDA